MKRLKLAMSLVVLAFVSAACGSSYDRAETVEELSSRDDISEDQAECIVDKMEEEIGEDRLGERGDSNDLTSEEEQIITDATFDCVLEDDDAGDSSDDPAESAVYDRSAVIEELTSSGDISEDQAECIADKMEEEIGEDRLAEDDGVLTSEEEQIVIDATFDCVLEDDDAGNSSDLGSAMGSDDSSELAVYDRSAVLEELKASGVPQDQAECVVDALEEEIGEERLAAGGAPTPEEEQTVIDATLECMLGDLDAGDLPDASDLTLTE